MTAWMLQSTKESMLQSPIGSMYSPTGQSLADASRFKRQMDELRESVSALVACLSDTGVLREETFKVQIQKQNFEKMRLKHPCNLELSMNDTLVSGESIPLNFARFLDIREVGSVMATGRTTWQAFSDGGVSCSRGSVRLFVCGGSDQDHSALRTVEVFNPHSGRWEEAEPLSQPRTRAVAGVVGESLYVCGGGSRLNSVEVMNLATGVWQAGPSTLQSRLGAAGATFDGYLYLCGGNDHMRTLSTVERLKPSVGRWEPAPPMLQPRAYATAATIRGCLYICGGVYRGQPSISTEWLHRSGQAWEAGPVMLQPRAYHASAEFLDSVFVVGGQGQGCAQPLNSVEQFDPKVGYWMPAQYMWEARLLPSAAALNGRLYVCGGYVNGTASNTMERFDPLTGKWYPVPSMRHPRGFAASAVYGGFV